MSLYEILAPFSAGIAGGLLVIVPFILYVRHTLKNLDLSTVFQQFLKSEEATARQTNSSIARTSKEAQKRIGADLIENSPLKTLLGFLSEETVDYLLEHPESLPEVLNKWAPTIQVAYPIIEKFLGNMKFGQQTQGSANL